MCEASEQACFCSDKTAGRAGGAPAQRTMLVLVAVSQATLDSGSCSRQASRMASETWSHSCTQGGGGGTGGGSGGWGAAGGQEYDCPAGGL